MGLFVSNGRFLASSHFDSVKGEAFLRLLGGGVEFGERSDDALRREMREEISAEIEQLRLLDVLENCFVNEGRPGHEVTFVYHAVFVDRSFYSRESIPVIETSTRHTATWTPAADLFAGKVRLYPVADYAKFLKLIDEQNM